MTYGKEKRSPTQISIDRIDNTRGYEIGNVRLVCFWVNNALSNMNLDALLYFSKRIVDHCEATGINIPTKIEQTGTMFTRTDNIENT
jgi:hypothetical protein